MVSRGKLGMKGDLHIHHVRPNGPHRLKHLARTPWGRLLWTRDRGESLLTGDSVLASRLLLEHRDSFGRLKGQRDLGSGLVTNVGVNLMSNDFSWAGGATLKQANFHAIGTGATAAALTDAWLQTANGVTNISGSTNGYMTGTQSVIANATGTPWSPIYQTQATFTFTGAVAVTEWILGIGNGANVAGTASATSSTSLTGSGFPTAGNGAQLWTVEALSSGAIPVNTPTTTATLQVASNSATVLTGLDNSWGTGVKTWLGLNNQAQATPGATTLYVAFPTAWDHKQFAVVNTANGDTIQFTYQLSINSGG